MYKTLVYDKQEYEGFLIDEDGNIINKKTNHLYKKSIANRGYYVVYLAMGKRGKVKAIRVHKAVAETFIPNPDNLPVVHHIDNNKLNPNVNNLRWVTYKTNTNEYWKFCKDKTPYFNNRKLTELDVRYIRSQKGIIGCTKLARQFGVSKVTIQNVFSAKFYKDISRFESG